MSDALATLRFNTLAFEVYGSQYVARLSDHRGVHIRSVQRWASGAREPPPELLEHLAGQVSALTRFGIVDVIRDAAQAAIEEGADRFVVAGMLERISAELRNKPDVHLGSGYLQLPANFEQDSD